MLHEDTETRAAYPFAFRLEIAFALDDDALETTFTVANPGREVLPASLGAHPAFVWPLVEGVDKEAHVLEFAEPETAPVHRLDGGLLKPEPEPTPIAGQTLALDPALFAADAVILTQPASRSVRYTALRRAGDRGGLGRVRTTRHLVARRRRFRVHRALARHGQPDRLRRRVPRQARADADPARRAAHAVDADQAVLTPGSGRVAHSE